MRENASGLEYPPGNYLARGVEMRPKRTGRKLAKVAAVLLSADLALTGALNIQSFKLDHMDDAPELSRQVTADMSTFFGRHLQLRCIETPEILQQKEVKGYTFVGAVPVYELPVVHRKVRSKRIFLSVKVCERLADLDIGQGTEMPLLQRDDVEELVAVAHEMVHTRGVGNEAQAECEALQVTAGALASYGYDTRAMQIYADSIEQTMPPEYRSVECHVGGKLDMGNTAGTSNVWLPRE